MRGKQLLDIGYWLLDIGLSPLTSNCCFPLANKDHHCRNSSKQQHNPCFANRSWITWVTTTLQTTTCVFNRSALINIRISGVASACGGRAISIPSARNHAGRRSKGLIHCGLVGVVRWLLCIAIAIIRSTIRCVGARVVWRVALRGGIYLRGKRHCTYTHQNAYHNDMQRLVKEAIRIGKMIVFVSHDCIQYSIVIGIRYGGTCASLCSCFSAQKIYLHKKRAKVLFFAHICKLFRVFLRFS